MYITHTIKILKFLCENKMLTKRQQRTKITFHCQRASKPVKGLMLQNWKTKMNKLCFCHAICWLIRPCTVAFEALHSNEGRAHNLHITVKTNNCAFCWREFEHFYRIIWISLHISLWIKIPSDKTEI